MDSKLPLMNLHIHSVYSDGKSTIGALVKRALKANMEYLAVMDHFTNSWKTKAISSLDSPSVIREYLAEISHWQSNLTQQNESLHVFKGIEIDLGSTYEYITDLINPQKFDLILFEYLENFEGLNFVQKLLKTWKGKTDGVLFGLAHFDPSYFCREDYPHLGNFLQRNRIFYELNSRYQEYFSLKYSEFFHILKEKEIPISIGTDAHQISRIADVSVIYRRIEEFDLQNNVLLLLDMLQ